MATASRRRLAPLRRACARLACSPAEGRRPLVPLIVFGLLAIASIGWALTRPAGPARRRGIVWCAAIVAGIVVAAILLLVPRALSFEPDARDACAELGAEYVGLATTGGRYADPVPEAARCTGAGEPTVFEVSVNFFASSGTLDAILAWLYRLACLLAPIATGLLIGLRLSSTKHPPLAPDRL